MATPLNERPEIEVTHDDTADFWTFGREAYQATFGGYDLGCLVGTGRTPLDAIVDLLDQADTDEWHRQGCPLYGSKGQ